MKKTIKICSATMLIISIILTFSSCSTKMSNTQIDSLLKTAIKNTYNADLYYYKESIINGKNSVNRNVNVYTEFDSKYEPIVDENGNYAKQKIYINESENQKTTMEQYCGLSEKSDKSTNGNYLLTANYKNGEKISANCTKISANEYYKSDEFEKYRLYTNLKELENLTAKDMNFTTKDAEIIKKGKVVRFVFAITPEYLENYQQQNGEKSMFDNSTKISIEISYDRISHIIIYSQEVLDKKFKIDVERYKFEVVYLGPKVKMPNYDTWVK